MFFDPSFAPASADASTREHAMAGWFELSKSTDDQFRFVLKADNAQTILSSQQYTTRGSAEGGIASVQANCADDARY